MLRNNAVSGLNFRSNDSLPACAASNITSIPFPKRGKRTSASLEIVYTDVCGPMPIPSQGSARYLLTLTDDYSRWTEVYFLKHKSEVSSRFLEYKRYAEMCTGRKIKAIQFDNGGEFCNAIMDSILKEFGIRCRLSAPHIPQQNGLAERKNRTLIESTRCMLNESGLLKSFWAEAIATANYVRNRCVTKYLGKKTPHEILTHKRPNVSHLQKFGVKAYVLDQTPNKDKFAPKGIEGIFVGYFDTSKAYRIWIPFEKKVRTSRNVKFLWDFPSGNNLPNKVASHDRESSYNDVSNQEDQHAIIPHIESTNQRSTSAYEDIEIQEENIVRGNNLSSSADAGDEMRQATGRPCKILTGKPGRPAKQYNLQSAVSNSHELGITENSDDESQEYVDAEFAMIASEIPFQRAISGPDRDE